MGRRRLYATDEERHAAGRERSRLYYESKREAICGARRMKYDIQKAKKVSPVGQTGKSSKSLTDEERKFKNRMKSRRYYERKKSVIKLRRQSHRSGRTTSSSATALGCRVNSSIWQQHLSYFWGELPKALQHKDVKTFVDGVATCYLRDGLRSGLENSYKPLKDLDRRVRNFQADVLNKLGAGAELKETMALLSEIDRVVELLEDLELLAIGEGRPGFMEKYTQRELLYQRRLR